MPPVIRRVMRVPVRTGQGLPRSGQLSPSAQKPFVHSARNTAKLTLAPLWHAVSLDSVASTGQIDFFANLPAGNLNWWESNLKQPYVQETTRVFGIKLYFLGAAANVGAAFDVQNKAQFTTAGQFPAVWNAINNGVATIKVNQFEYPQLRASKFLAPLNYQRYGYNTGVIPAITLVDTGEASILQTDSNAGYYIFRNPANEIDPIELGEKDRLSVSIRMPVALPAAANIPDNYYVVAELWREAINTLYAG